MKKTLNVKYLGCCLGICLVLGTGVHFVHAFQVKRNAGSLLTQARQSEEKGDLVQAADYYNRYLGLAPKDTDARARFGLLLAHEKFAKSEKVRLRALLVLDDVLRRDPQRQDVRRQAARLALDLQRFADARDHLEALRKSIPDDAELEQLLARCHEGRRNYQEARKCLENAIKLAPQEIGNYERLALLLRSRTDELLQPKDQTRADLLKLADQTMDAMVAANEDTFKAYLARARYRKVFASSGDGETLKAAEKDMDRARELAPDDVDVLLAAADVAQDQHDPQKARSYLQQARQIHPREWHVYQALAKLETLQERPEEAVACLRAGLAELPKQVELLWSLADLLVQQGHQQEARETITRLGQEGVAQAELDYLNAGLLANEAKWLEAARLLEAAYPLLFGLANPNQDLFVATLIQQSGLLLGRCYVQLGDSERAYAAYSRVVARDPSSVPGRLGMAQMASALGRVDDSLDHYRQLARLPDMPPAVWIDLARLLIHRIEQSERADWSEVEHALDEAGKVQPPPVEVAILRAEILAARAQRQDDNQAKQKLFDQARTLLEKSYPDKPSRPIDVWTALATLEDLRGRAASALALFAEAEKERGDSVDLRLARAQYWVRHPGTEAGKAVAKLAQDFGQFKPDDQQRLLQGAADACLQIGALAESERLWQQLADLRLHHVQSRLVLLDLAFQVGNEVAMERQVQELHRIEGEEGILWRYGEVCRLIRRAKNKKEKEELTEARALVSEIARRRANWSRVPLCEAQIDELLGNEDAALVNYTRALQLGERGTLALRRTLELLYARRRYVEAHDLLQKIPRTTLMSGGLQHVAAEVSLQVKDGLHAVLLAQSAVSEDSKDYRDHLWLGHVLAAAGRAQEAERALDRARDMADTVPDVWVALIQFLVSSGQKEKAQAELAKAERKLPADQANLALAQCYEALGRRDRAGELYQAALTARPDDITTVQALAGFYIRTCQFQEAQPYLRRIRDGYQSKAPDAAAWARRMLALVLTLAGDYQQAREALLNFDRASSGQGRDATLDQRTRAWLLAAQKNQRDRRQAIRILEELTERESATPEDQFLLALLYEVTGSWPKARLRWRNLLEQNEATPLQLSQCALSLLRHGDVLDAEQVFGRLKKLEPNSATTQEIEARILTAKGKGNKAIALLKAQASSKDVNLAALAAILEELGHASAAEEMYRKFVEQSSEPQSILVLAAFLGRQKRFREALEMCDVAWEACPAVAVAQTAGRVLAAAPDDPAQAERLERRLQAALQKSPEVLSLWSALAYLRHTQGRYEEAEAICRQILQKDSHNVTALNNLAWLLAFQGGPAAQQALELVQQAFQIIGPHPRLLDTRAVVYLALGQVDLALSDLDDVIAENPEPSTYFHLAQARLMTKDTRAAGDALREAKSRGLDETSRSLHPSERAAYRQLCRELRVE